MPTSKTAKPVHIQLTLPPDLSEVIKGEVEASEGVSLGDVREMYLHHILQIDCKRWIAEKSIAYSRSKGRPVMLDESMLGDPKRVEDLTGDDGDLPLGGEGSAS